MIKMRYKGSEIWVICERDVFLKLSPSIIKTVNEM